MKTLKGILNFYINSSFHVALSVLSFTYLTYFELDIPISSNVLGFVFFATIVGYNFVKYLGFHSLFQKNKRQVWLWTIAVITIISLAMVLGFLGRFQNNTIVVVIFLGLLTFFYAMPLSVKNYGQVGQFNLRGLYGIKVFIIAFVWTFTTVILPVIESESVFSLNIFPLIVQRFLWILVLMIPFEIRDLKYDHESLGTLPQKFGIESTKILGYVFLIIIIILEVTKSSNTKWYFWILLLLVLFSAAFIWGTKSKNSDYYSAFWVESLPIFWLALVLIFG